MKLQTRLAIALGMLLVAAGIMYVVAPDSKCPCGPSCPCTPAASQCPCCEPVPQVKGGSKGCVVQPPQDANFVPAIPLPTP